MKNYENILPEGTKISCYSPNGDGRIIQGIIRGLAGNGVPILGLTYIIAINSDVFPEHPYSCIGPGSIPNS